MKKVTLVLLYFLSVHLIYAQKSNTKTFIGFQTGVIAPVMYNSYAISKYKIGLPSFSYSASIENRFTLNYKLNFSLQYSISFFNIMQKNLEKNISESAARIADENKKANEVTSNINFNTIYRINKDLGVVGGVGIAKPFDFMDKNSCRKNSLKTDCNPQGNNKFIPTLNPFFIIGIENSCTIFRKNLIYSIQYNIGFVPYRTLPMQKSNESPYMHGVNIGLKYKY